jgi:pimeloyl-ACP methyl ester carboxylesterase
MRSVDLNIPAGENVVVSGILTIPENPRSLVLFSHGSGSSRFSTRNKFVADVLNDHNIATLLVDLLSEKEDRIFENRFNIDLLTGRLIEISEYMRRLRDTARLPAGYFGASTGAASALKAATKLDDYIGAVVCRGGRPDLAEDVLANVTVPTLLIVGGLDEEVIKLNRKTYGSLQCIKMIEVVEGASHLFEEPGKLDEVAALASDWFSKHLLPRRVFV